MVPNICPLAKKETAQEPFLLCLFGLYCPDSARPGGKTCGRGLPPALKQARIAGLCHLLPKLGAENKTATSFFTRVFLLINFDQVGTSSLQFSQAERWEKNTPPVITLSRTDFHPHRIVAALGQQQVTIITIRKEVTAHSYLHRIVKPVGQDLLLRTAL